MGEAFAVGLRRKNRDQAIVIFDLKRERIEKAASLGLAAARSPDGVFADADATILCVKPQDFLPIAQQLDKSSRGRRVISIMAARKIQTISEALGTEQVVRLNPSVASVKGLSPIGVCAHPGADRGFVEQSMGIAEALGTPVAIPEKLFAAMAGVSGSGIAFIFSFVNAMALGGVAGGLSYNAALTMIIQTLEGAVGLMRDGNHPMELVNRVCSPGGSTIRGIAALERGAVTGSIMEAVKATIDRINEMEV